ncbi:MAG: hypothetical protein V3T53_02255 [Phycisphaerales bacterium]
MTLSQFNDYYLDRRKQQTSGRGYRKQAPKLTESTLRSHKTALMYLTTYFGETCRLDTIAVDEAEAWIEALEAGQFAKTKGKNRIYGKDLSESSVRLYASKAKAIYNWAKLVGLVQTNPFGDLDTALIGAETRTYVSVDQFEAVIEKSPSAGWSAMFGLCRLAGLRREAARLILRAGSIGPASTGIGGACASWATIRPSGSTAKFRSARGCTICLLPRGRSLMAWPRYQASPQAQMYSVAHSGSWSLLV